jgi:hypothetical protein
MVVSVSSVSHTPAHEDPHVLCWNCSVCTILVLCYDYMVEWPCNGRILTRGNRCEYIVFVWRLSVGESRQLKRLLSMMKMMVWCFASNAHMVTTALIVVLSSECCCGAFSLQFHCYACLKMLGLWSIEVKVSKEKIDLWFTIVALEIPNSWILRKKTKLNQKSHIFWTMLCATWAQVVSACDQS